VDIRRVERLSDLARLSLSPLEAEKLQGELSSILEYFAALDSVKLPSNLGDEAAGRPALQAGDDKGEERVAQQGQEDEEHATTREDIVVPSTPEPILEGVPQRKGRYVRAPRVF
jgi:Asp-tRNA(Asn)/Glu-tRNA(Gln) amidotransferase C subunit